MASIQVLAVANYRSVRSIIAPLGALNVVSGPNGSGKSNLYRALRLLADAASGSIVASLAGEGGLSSALWAGVETPSRGMKSGADRVEGTRRKEPVSLRLGFLTDAVGYAIDLGLPTPQGFTAGGEPSAFQQDPEIKMEAVWAAPTLRPASRLVERHGPVVKIRRDDGEWEIHAEKLPTFESMLARVADPQRAPELMKLRDEVRAWRFYDHFRTDRDSPGRRPQLGTRTPVLAHDGHDVAAAIRTIQEIGDPEALAAAVSDAFPGASVAVSHGGGVFELQFEQHGLLRPLGAAELSDGTLRYLLWIAALLTPRPPPLMVLNEPETSLHPDLLPALARLIASAAERSQVWVVSHSARLINALKESPSCQSLVLDKELGESSIVDQRDLDQPPWRWPER